MGTVVELINGWVLPVVAAPFIGSFLGVVIRRLPAGRPIATSRSACEACGHALGAPELVPLLSYAALRGRCRHCHAAISLAHPAYELAALAVAVSAACVTPPGPMLWAGCLLGWTLLPLAWIDFFTFRLPDVLTLPLILAGLAEAELLQPGAITIRALGALLGYASLWLLAFVYRRARRREGLGLGDAKLLAAGGAWIGAYALPWLATMGSLLALLFAATLRLSGKRLGRTYRLPFGPFMALAIWLTWLLVQYDPPP